MRPTTQLYFVWMINMCESIIFLVILERTFRKLRWNFLLLVLNTIIVIGRSNVLMNFVVI